MSEECIICKKCNVEMLPCKKEFDTHTTIAYCPKCGDEYNSTSKEQFIKMYNKVKELWTDELVEATKIVLEKIKINEDYREFFMDKLEEVAAQIK